MAAFDKVDPYPKCRAFAAEPLGQHLVLNYRRNRLAIAQEFIDFVHPAKDRPVFARINIGRRHQSRHSLI